jgi:hypothetical protein
MVEVLNSSALRPEQPYRNPDISFPPISLLLLILASLSVQLLHLLAIFLSLYSVQRIFNQADVASERPFYLIESCFLFFKVVGDLGL